MCWFAWWFLVLPPLPLWCDLGGLAWWLHWPLVLHQNLYFRGELMTFAVGQWVTGNTGMERQLILASSRWHRWVRWSAPRGRPPTPGCRSSRTRLSPAPSPNSSPCRWWLRSSRTNLQGEEERGGRWVNAGHCVSSAVSLFLCCSLLPVLSWAELRLAVEASRSVFPRRHPSTLHHGASCLLNTIPDPVSLPGLPTSLLRHGMICLSNPRTASLPDISTCAAGCMPSIIPVWLSGHLGARQCTGTIYRANLGCWKGLPREDTMDWQLSCSLAKGHEVQ